MTIEDRLEALPLIPIATQVAPVAIGMVSGVIKGLKKRKELDDYQIQQLQSLPPEYQAMILGELRNSKNKRKDFPAIFDKYLKKYQKEKKTATTKRLQPDIKEYIPFIIGGVFLLIIILLIKRR